MKKLLFFSVSSSIGIGLFIWAIKKIGWGRIWEIFRNFSIWSVFIILGLSLMIVFIGSRKWQIILRSQGYRLPFLKIFRAYLIGYSLDYLTPFVMFGGEVIRGYAIKEDSLEWEKIIASITIDKILDCIFFFLTVISGLLLFNYQFGLSLIGSKIIFAGLVLFSLIILFFYFRIKNKKSIVKFFICFTGLEKSKSGEAIVKAEKEVFSFLGQRKNFIRVIPLTVLRLAAFLARHWVLLYLLGMRVDVLKALSILSFTFLAYFFPLPALLGSHEVIQLFAFPVYGLASQAAAAFTLILRTGDLLLAFSGIALLFHSWSGILFEFLKRRFKIKQ